MKCFYINLDSAPERRAALEASFRAHAPAHWSLERVGAVPASQASRVDGAIKPGAKGCFLSHIEAVRLSMSHTGDVLIVEDDARFGAQSFQALERLTAAQRPWDLMFTNADIRGAPDWLWFVRQYGQLRASTTYALKDLAEIRFAGTVGYVVRHAAKGRVLQTLEDVGFDLPFDLRLDDLFRRGVLSGVLAFPFVIGLSGDAHTSQIDEDSPLNHPRIAARYVFRHLWFVDSEPADYAAPARVLEQLGGASLRAAGLALAILLSSEGTG